MLSPKYNALEDGQDLLLDFSKLQQVAECGQLLVPVVAQDAVTGEVLIVAHANRQALVHSLTEKIATFWSTSRNELWIKGATSGDYLDIVDVWVNCEQNALLYRVKPRRKGACHTLDDLGEARPSCFYRRIEGSGLVFG